MNITYSQNGDYRIPNIVIRKTKPIGHYGRLRKAYLETYRPSCSMSWSCLTRSMSIAPRLTKRHEIAWS